MNVAERAAATRKTLDVYRKREFNWDGATCIHLARAHLRNMGHKPPPLPKFMSPIGAKRAMKQAGFAGLADIFDGLGLMRINPAQMLVGDLATLAGDDDMFDAVVISAGAKLLGWHGAGDGGIEAIAGAMGDIKAAWRV